MSSKKIDAISQYMMIPMGMGLYYSVIWQYAWKPLFVKSKYEGEIGSSDDDDPFTQEEKIGYVSKGKEPEKGKERKPAEELQRERQREGSREQDERDYREFQENKLDILYSAGYGR